MMLLGFLMLLFVGLSVLLAFVDLCWCIFLLATGKSRQAFMVLALATAIGAILPGLLFAYKYLMGGSIGELSTISWVLFVVGFAWSAAALSVSLRLWPYFVQVIGQSRRWGDRSAERV